MQFFFCHDRYSRHGLEIKFRKTSLYDENTITKSESSVLLKALKVSFLLACTTFVPLYSFPLFIISSFLLSIFFILSLLSVFFMHSFFFLSLFLYSFFFSPFFLLFYLFFLPYFISLCRLHNKRPCYTQSSYEECRPKVCAKRSVTVSSIKAV